MGQLAEYEEYLRKSNCKNFVETGCYRGEGLQKASEHFTNLFSCDISARYVQICRRLFPQATIFHADSVAFLRGLCPNLKGQTVFWLDAHYPNQYDPNIEENSLNKFPLDEELKVIRNLKAGYEHDFIICDDLRVVQSDDNPVRGDIGVRNLKERHLIFEKTFSSYVNVFKETHGFKLVGLDGLIFIPIGASL